MILIGVLHCRIPGHAIQESRLNLEASLYKSSYPVYSVGIEIVKAVAGLKIFAIRAPKVAVLSRIAGTTQQIAHRTIVFNLRRTPVNARFQGCSLAQLMRELRDCAKGPLHIVAVAQDAEGDTVILVCGYGGIIVHHTGRT